MVPVLRQAGHTVEAWPHSRGDVTDAAAVDPAVSGFKPDWIVHLAAFTAVDRCESEPDEAFRVNVEGSRTVAAAAHRAKAGCLVLSSDYVFDGAASAPYGEDAPARPLSVYGRSKLESERAVSAACGRALVVRTAWLFGPGGPNFVDTILRLAAERETVPVVSDQRGCPTYVPFLSRALVRLLEAGAEGVYHLAGDGEATWYDLAQAACLRRGLPADRLQPVTTEAFPRPAPRPPYSVLDCTRVREEHGVALPSWRRGIEEYVKP